MLRMLLASLVLSLAVISGCASDQKSSLEKYSETKMLMGTIVQIDVCRDDQNASKIKSAYDGVWRRMEDISSRMNVFDEHSDVAKINNSNLKPVSIGADTYRVLKDSIYFARTTKGAFDITVWPLIKLWRESEEDNILPSRQQIKTARAAVGFENIQLLADNHVKLLNGETKVDLGAIAKGYAIDEAARIFREHGIRNFFIDAGGDIYVGGRNCIDELWHIGIRDPRDKSRILDVVAVTDSAVATSGNYEQYYEIQNEQWSHIINPVTGYPQKGVISTTVIAPKAIQADALATALCVLGGDVGTKYIDTLKEPYASLIIIRHGSGRIKKFVSQEFEKFQYKK